MMLVIEVLKFKLNLQITEIVSGMGELLYRHYAGVERYQATYIFYQFKLVHIGMICTLNEITAYPPAEFLVNNENEGIMHEY